MCTVTSNVKGKFSKIFFEHLYTGWTVVVHLWRPMAPEQSAKFRTAFLVNFDVILFTDYGVIAEKPPVGQLGRIFPFTL